jgi:hypothetical protein
MRQLIRNSVLLFVAGYVADVGILAAQSRDGLRRKYGEPVAETFIVRPDINVTATYGKDGRITEWVIAPRTTALIKSRTQTLSQDTVTAIFDELVPSAARGKGQLAGFLNVQCMPDNDCGGSTNTFEKVTIYYNAAAAGRVHYAVVQWR